MRCEHVGLRCWIDWGRGETEGERERKGREGEREKERMWVEERKRGKRKNWGRTGEGVVWDKDRKGGRKVEDTGGKGMNGREKYVWRQADGRTDKEK